MSVTLKAMLQLSASAQRPQDRRVWDLRDQIRPFIIESGPVFEIKLDEIQREDSKLLRCGLELDLPFPVCFFEYADEASLITYQYPSTGRRVDIYGLVVEELSPEKINLFVIGGLDDHVSCELIDPDAWSVYIPSLKRLLEKIRQGALGTEALDLKVKVRLQGRNTHHRIKEIIRVVPKNARLTSKPLFSKIIDWSHRWEVMGHWRKTSGIGKNRSGDYSMVGFTWVVPHVKGPDSQRLVLKTRLIQSSPSPESR